VRRTAVLAAATAATAAFGAGLALRPHDGAPRPVPVLAQVREELAARYYRRLPPAVLGRPTVAGILGALHDRYTTYLTPDAYRLARRAYAGGYGGIGVTVLPGPGGLVVRGTLHGPAQIAGIKPGDTILDVDGASTAGLSFGEAVARIVGRPGSRISLVVRRDHHTLRFRLVRRHVVLQAVHARVVRRVGVIDIDTFSRGSARETAAAARALLRRHARALVLDLRGNPGGILSEAVGVASVFLRPGASVVSLRGAHRPLKILFAHGGKLTGTPLAVLVDGGSASASEVVAGALKDHGRATIVGRATFGKSLVQEVVELRGGGALELTVARYLTPAGVDISHDGIRPDVRTGRPLGVAISLFTRR